MAHVGARPQRLPTKELKNNGPFCPPQTTNELRNSQAAGEANRVRRNRQEEREISDST